LAIATNTEKVYRLIYDPASSHLHGNWSSLRESNLVHCLEPLHRLHRLPSNFAVPPSLDVVVVAQELFLLACRIAQVELNYPEAPDLRNFPVIQSDN
jgi:hypothetical protein